MKEQTTIETVRAAPAVGGAIIAGVTLNQAVMVATLCYILLQSGYLVWKWRKEVKEHKGKK